MKKSIISGMALRALVIFSSCCAFAGLKLAQSVEDKLHKIETGMEFTYLFDYSASKNDADYTQLVFTDALPDTVEFIRAEGTTHTYTPVYDAKTHTVQIGFKKPFRAGSAGQLAITVRFPFGTADKTKAGNQAELSDGPANETMKSDTVNVFAISGAQMAMWFSRQNAATPVDQPVTYRVAARLGNTSGYGCDILRHVALTATFPANTVFEGASGSYTYNETTRTVTWAEAGDLIPGSIDTIYRDVTVRYPSSAFSVDGKVTIAATTQSVPDSGGDPIQLSATRTETLLAAASQTEFIKQAVGRADFVYVGGKVGTILYNFPRIRNAGNTTLQNLTLEDTIPAEFSPTEIYIGTYDNVPATSDSKVSIHYKTTLNNDWRLVSGSPFITNPPSGKVTVGTTAGNAVVLATNEHITVIKWSFGDLQAPGRMGNVKIFGTVPAIDRNGSPLVAGQMITNTALFSWTDANGPQSETVEASSAVKTARPVGRLLSALIPDPNAGVTATVFPANANATISFSLENLIYAADALRAPVWGILLPVGVRPAGTPTIGTVSTSVHTVVPDHLAIYDYHNTGRVLIRFATTNAFPIYSGLEMRIPVFQPAGTTGGSKTADLYLLSYANDIVDGFTTTAVADTADFNGNGKTDDIMLVSSLSWTVPEQIAVDGTLEVRGALNGTNEWIKGTGATVAGGSVDYRLTIRNSGNTIVKDVHILDLLPSIGDTGVIDLTPRESAWQPILAGPVSAPAGVTELYSTEGNPEREDFTTEPLNATEPEWSALPPATITKTRALRFAFENQSLLPGQSLTFSWPMRAPVDAPEGAIAWNSFGYYVTIEGHASPTSAAEPQSVGVRIDADPLMSIGNHVWLDVNKDGIYQDGEPGINGIRATLYSISGTTTNEVAWTVTGPRNAGDGNDGYYTFPNLSAGTYSVAFTIPEDYTGQTAPADWTTFEGGIRSAPVVLTEANTIDVNLGLVLEGYSVSLVKTAGTAKNDEVFWATTGDQVLFSYAVTNTGTFTLTGFRISDPSLSGQVPAFPASLAPGAGFTTTASAAVSTPQNNTATVYANPASASDGREIPGSPAAAASDNAIVQIKSVISGTAWVDANLDGVRQLRETAPTNTVTAKLFQSAALVATVETDADGNYTFGSHTPGTYEIVFEAVGYSVSRQVLQIAAANRADASGRTPAFTVTADGTVDPQNIGLAPISVQTNLPSSVEGRVWGDSNGNGIQDANEQGLSGVPVILFNSATQVVAQCRTERSGSYIFTNIVSEQEYSLRFDPEGTWTSVVKNATSDFTRDSDINPETRTTDVFLLGSDLTLSSVDAGFRGGLPRGFWSDMNFINSFNAVILGKLVASGGDTEGRLLVGCDFNSGLIGYSIGFGSGGGADVVPDMGTETDTLIVGNSFFDANNFGINGNVVYGRDHIGAPRLWFNHLFRKIPTADIRIGINGNVATDGSGMTLGEIREFIESSSAILGALPNRGVTLVEKTEWNDLTLLGSDPELNVFNVTADFWSFSRGQVTVDAPQTSTIVINVLGETVDISNSTFNITNVPWSQVIVNYVNATNISLQGVDHNGALLAPAANLSLSGASINGTALVGGNASQKNGGEFHDHPFCGSFRLSDSSDYSALRLTITVNGSASGVIRQVARGSDAVISYRVENLGNLAVTNAFIVDSVAGTTNLIDYILPGQALAARNSLRNLTVSTNYTATVTGRVREYGEERSVSSSAFVRIEVTGTSSDSDEEEVASGDSTSSSGNVSVTDHVSINRADLAVSDMQFVLQPTLTGQVFTVSATIANNGQLDAENFEVMFYLDSNGTVRTGTAGDCAPIRISKLAAGDSIEVVQTLVSPAEKGWYRLRAFVDWQDTVKEWSKGDNQFTLSYYTVPASLNIEIQTDGSVLLSWNCFWGQSYSILYSTDLKTFPELETGIQPDFSSAPYGAKESVNYYLIQDPPATPTFFRLRVDQY